MADYLIRDVL